METITVDANDLAQLIERAITKVLDQQDDNDALWDRKKAASFLGIKEQTLSVMASQGRGPAPTKIGSRALYRPEIVRQYAKDNTLPR